MVYLTGLEGSLLYFLRFKTHHLQYFHTSDTVNPFPEKIFVMEIEGEKYNPSSHTLALLCPHGLGIYRPGIDSKSSID